MEAFQGVPQLRERERERESVTSYPSWLSFSVLPQTTSNNYKIEIRALITRPIFSLLGDRGYP